MQISRESLRIRPFQLPCFSFEETRTFFFDKIKEPSNLQTIFKVSNGVPGNQASIRRLLESGVKEEDLINELPENMPELFELEWKVVEKEDNNLLRNALAIIAFDQRRHSLTSLSRLCKTDSATLKEKLDCCNFVEQRNDGMHIDFVGDVFNCYASKRLLSLRKATLDNVISDLLYEPDSSEALTHLPGLYQQAERYEELLTYLSPQHIDKLIDCSESWTPLHQKADLGVNISLNLKRDGDLMRFALQRSTIASMENSEPWRSEIEAYVALDDFPAAYALIQRVATKADRLHLLAIIARMKKTKLLPIEIELEDQIHQLYEQIDRSNLGERGVEIASELLYTHPELAIDLVQDSMSKGGLEYESRLDLALANLSLKAMMEKQKGTDEMRSIHQTFRSKIKSPTVQKFMERVNLFVGDYSASGVISEVSKWEKPSDRIYALRAWIVTNAKQKDAMQVVDYAINTILQTTTYTANAKVYQELASPLIYMLDIDQVKATIGRLDGLREPIKSAGPTLEYVKLQVTLAEAESRYDHLIAADRLLEIYLNSELMEPGTRLGTLAILTYALKKITGVRPPELFSELSDLVVNDLESVVDEILTKTAEHYEAVQSAIEALALSDAQIALRMIRKLNTNERREAALVKPIHTVAAEPLTDESFNILTEAYSKIKTIPMCVEAIRAILGGMSKQKKFLVLSIKQFYILKQWIGEIPDAEEKCQSLCVFLELLFVNKDLLTSAQLSDLQQELNDTWNSVDSGWSKIDTGFKITARLSEFFPDISRKFLAQTEEARKVIILDSPDTANTYFLCVQLAIRCFTGLLKRKNYNEDDLNDLKELIDKIPSAYFRVIAYSKLALRFFLAQDPIQCKKIVEEQIRLLLDPERISDKEVLWDSIIYAAPALHCVHSTSTIELINTLPNPYKDDAYIKICSFLISKRLPMDTYDSASRSTNKVTYLDFLDIYNLLELMESDSAICWKIESLVDSMHNNFRNFNKAQQADIQKKLLNLAATKFQTADGIQHEGYKILTEAQIARLDRHNNPWETFKNRANAISNLADRAFVLMQVAAVIPNKYQTLSFQCIQNSKALIPQIPFFEDRLNHYETLAEVSENIDKNFSKECLRLAWKEANPLSDTKLPKARERIIDSAYRLDPDFATILASETDNDPGRDLARNEVKQRLQTLTLRKQASNGAGMTPSVLTQNKKQRMDIIRMLLSGLNSDLVTPSHIESTRRDVQDASHLDLQNAYIIYSWVVENAIHRYANTVEANSLIRPLYEAVRLSSDLAFRIAARIRSVTDSGIDFARRAEDSTDNGLIRKGERDRALEMLGDWASEATGFIKITDPYFGLDELDLIKLIRAKNPEIDITILTSRVHQQDIPKPWEESYRSHWRRKISYAEPGNVDIIIIGKGSIANHPIHDRWWLSKESGLRLGTSPNGLGVRSSEISKISKTELPNLCAEVDRYILRQVRYVETERLEHSSFNL